LGDGLGDFNGYTSIYKKYEFVPAPQTSHILVLSAIYTDYVSFELVESAALLSRKSCGVYGDK
jgi:hypothetical protein